MDLGLHDRVALITAASQGLGKSIALGLAREGAKLTICSRQQERIDRAAEDIRAATGAEILALQADVSRPDDIQRLVTSTIDRFGRIDILVPNAGGPPLGGLMDHDDEAWMQAVELTLMSTVRLIRAVVPHMRRQGRGGRIVTLSSFAVKEPPANYVLTNSIRPGVIGLTKTLSRELAADRILINDVAPGYIRTERLSHAHRVQAEREGRSVDEVAQELAREVPLGRYGDPEEFANVVVFLASERASYVTGTTIQVDGGYVRSLL